MIDEKIFELNLPYPEKGDRLVRVLFPRTRKAKSCP